MPATIVSAVKQQTDSRCHATSCSDSGCSLQLTGALQPFALIHLENGFSPADKSKPHCDYLFVGGPDDEDGGPRVAPVELGSKKASALLAQLRGGASIAAGLLPASVPVKFKPVFAHAGGLHRHEVEILRDKASKVRLGTANASVTIVRSGSRLADALKR